jgi:hypothetical protein
LSPCITGWFIEKTPKLKSVISGNVAATREGCDIETSVEIRLEAFPQPVVMGLKQDSFHASTSPGRRAGPQPRRGYGARLEKAFRELLFRLPRVGQRIHFKNIGPGYRGVTVKSYAELA